MVTLKEIALETAEVVVNGQLRKDGSLHLALNEKKSNRSETLIIEAEAS